MKNLVLVFFLLASISLGAQDIRSYIPSDITYLLSWNAGRVNEKVNTRQLMQQESFDLVFRQMVQGLDSVLQEEYHALWTSPETYGINTQQSMHFFGRNDQTGHFYALLVPLDAPELLEGFIDRMGGLVSGPVSIETHDGFRMSRLGGYYLAWNQEVVLMAGGKTYEIFDWGWEEAYEEEEYGYEEEYQDEEAAPVEEEPLEEIYVEEEWQEEAPAELVGWISEVLNRSFGSSLLSHPEYKTVASKPSDAHVWADYAQIMQLSQAGTPVLMPGGAPGLETISQFMNSLYDGMYYSLSMDFEKGELKVKSRLLGKGRMVHVMKEAYRSRFNRKMLRYVDGRFLLGYYTIQVNVEKLAEGIKDIVYDAMQADPLYGQTATAMMDALGILIDEDALYELFKGDIFVAMTGMREVEIPVETYEYDQDFNPARVEKTIRKQHPEFLVMASYGNEENMRKLVALGESLNGFLNMGSYYQTMGSDLSNTYYLAMKNGLLLFTNDGGLIEEKLGSGVEPAARLGKIHRKNLRKHVQSVYWDVQRTWEVMQQADMSDSDPKILEIMQDIQEKITAVSLNTSRRVKPSINGSVQIELKDRETNALEQMVGLLNRLILEAAGLERI